MAGVFRNGFGITSELVKNKNNKTQLTAENAEAAENCASLLLKTEKKMVLLGGLGVPGG